MEMKGEKIIFTSKEKVWEALNDPEQLLKAIPGAQSVEKIDDENLIATVKTKIGPISAKFNGKIKLSDLNPPHSYKLTGEGTGGAAGFAKGQAEGFSTEQISVEGVSTESANNVSGNGTIAQPEASPGTVGDAVLEAQSRFSDTTTSQGLGANESDFMQARIGRIQSAYLQAYTPSREGLSLQA